MRYGVNDSPDSQVIVSNRRGRPGFALGSTRGVVVWKTKKDELRHGVLACVAGGNEIVEFVQEFIGPELIGIGDLEIRKQGIEVATEFDFRSDILGQDWDGPRVGARAAARVADIIFQSLALVDGAARAAQAVGFGRSGAGRICALFRVAPAAHDVFAVMSVRYSVAGEILPEIPTGRLAGIGKLIFGRDAAK